MPERRKRWKRVLKWGAACLAVVLAAVGVYGVLVEPRLILDERHYTVALPGLTQQQAGTEVAVFSDIQVGMWWSNTGMVERVVDRVVAQDPDVVLLAGDFVYSSDPDPATQIDTVLRLLAPLTDGDAPVFAVLGNHDHAVGAAEELTTALQEHGVQVLRNEAAPVPGAAGGDAEHQLHVVGVGPAGVGLADPEQALAGVPEQAPRVVMTHNPTAFPELPAGSAPLTVAGHTHCGQVALPLLSRWSYLGLTEEEEVVADGWAPEGYGAEGNRMFVTCGIGFSIVPVRINAAPQLALFQLVAEQDRR